MNRTQRTDLSKLTRRANLLAFCAATFPVGLWSQQDRQNIRNAASRDSYRLQRELVEESK
jgi:hypothetical protein